MKKNYNSTRRKLFLPEYGRHIHEMVDSLLEIEDRRERTRQAMRYGELKAVLWHQGESDSGRPDTYLDSLSVFVRGLRDSLDVGNVPFVAGEVGHWTANADAFNGMLSHISEYILSSDYVSSEGCSMLKDVSDPHFSRDGQLLLGRRYASKVLEMTGPGQ